MTDDSYDYYDYVYTQDSDEVENEFSEASGPESEPLIISSSSQVAVDDGDDVILPCRVKK